MTYRKEADFEVVLDLCRELQQAEVVGHRRTLLADPCGHLLLGEAAFLDEPLIAQSHFDRVEVLTLDVLHDSHLEHSLVVGVADVCRNHVHSREPACPEAALAADDLVSAVSLSADGDRLDEAQCPDRLRQLLESLLVEGHSRLERVRLYEVCRDKEHVCGAALLRLLFAYHFLVYVSDRLSDVSEVCCVISEKSAKAFAKSSLLLAHAVTLLLLLLLRS